jgi:hypothetical protein
MEEKKENKLDNIKYKASLGAVSLFIAIAFVYHYRSRR